MHPVEIDPNQVPEFMNWRSGFDADAGLDLWDYVSHMGNTSMAAAYASILWPAFSESEGCILLDIHNISGASDEWMDRFAGDRSRVEAMINHFHLMDRLGHFKDDGSDLPVIRMIGHIMQMTWRAALQEAYPERTFVVSYDSDEQYGDPTITFWQVRDEQAVNS